jgi:UDP:flavonoid glycosyltransferase YjiC (YdhE family)
VLEALANTGQRGLLLTGWGGLRLESIPDNVFVLEAAPHSWLFPRTAAVVHHGGAGTTAEGLRAGVPSIIVPFILDQPFWGARVHAAGLGPKPISRKNLAADNLAEAIKTAVTDTQMRKRARDFGKEVRAENSITSAVSVVRRYFGEPTA